MRAIWNDAILAESSDTVVMENNYYFPRESLCKAHFRSSSHSSICPWKGEARYFDIVVGDAVNRDAAWYYPAPSAAADAIRGHVAFWKGVRIES